MNSLYGRIDYISDLFESKFDTFKNNIIANYYFKASLPSSSQDIRLISSIYEKHIIALHKKIKYDF